MVCSRAYLQKYYWVKIYKTIIYIDIFVMIIRIYS